MPAVKSLSEPSEQRDFAQHIKRVYRNAELEMLEKVRRRAERGINEEGWAEKKLAEVQQLQKEIEATIRKLDKQLGLVERGAADAYEKGGEEATAELIKSGIADLTADPRWIRRVGVRTMAQDAIGTLRNAHVQVLRRAKDVWRLHIYEVSQQVAAGVFSVREAVQAALNKFADKGITCFTDKNGRQWSLASYAEMAVRTTNAHAQIQGHTDRLLANHKDLVQVSDHIGECPLCRPFEGRVLSISGSSTDYPSLDSAIAAGLFHPNCEHRTHLWTPGLSVEMPPQGTVEDAKVLAEHRNAEKHVHFWKKRQKVAITAKERAKAARHLERWKDREHALRVKVEAAYGRVQKAYDKWLEAPLPSAETLRRLEARIVSDEFRVSEVQEVQTRDFFNAIGYGKPLQVVDSAEIDRRVAEGADELFRAVHAVEAAENTKFGELYVGSGFGLHGMHFAYTLEGASEFAGAEGVVMRGVLASDAKIITRTALDNLWEETKRAWKLETDRLVAEIQRVAKENPANVTNAIEALTSHTKRVQNLEQFYGQDLSRLAAAHGWDAVRQFESPGIGGDELVVLNRSKLILQRTNLKPSRRVAMEGSLARNTIFSEITSKTDMWAFIENQSFAGRDDVKRETLEALQKYQSPKYREINIPMRSGNVVEPAIKEAIANIREPFKYSTVPDNVIVFRGLKHAEWAANPQGMVGSVIEHACFCSTTLDREFASNMMQFAAGAKEDAIMLEIRVPAGAPGVSISKITRERFNEAEILLDGGSKFKVLEAHPAKAGSFARLVLEMLI